MRFYPGQEHFVGITCVYPPHIGQYGSGVLRCSPLALFIHPPNSPGYPQHDGSAKGCAIPPKSKAHEVQRLLILLANLPITLHFEAIGMHPVFDLNAHFVEFLFVRAKDHHIIQYVSYRGAISLPPARFHYCHPYVLWTGYFVIEVSYAFHCCVYYPFYRLTAFRPLPTRRTP